MNPFTKEIEQLTQNIFINETEKLIQHIIIILASTLSLKNRRKIIPHLNSLLTVEKQDPKEIINALVTFSDQIWPIPEQRPDCLKTIYTYLSKTKEPSFQILELPADVKKCICGKTPQLLIHSRIERYCRCGASCTGSVLQIVCSCGRKTQKYRSKNYVKHKWNKRNIFLEKE